MQPLTHTQLWQQKEDTSQAPGALEQNFCSNRSLSDLQSAQMLGRALKSQQRSTCMLSPSWDPLLPLFSHNSGFQVALEQLGEKGYDPSLQIMTT